MPFFGANINDFKSIKPRGVLVQSPVRNDLLDRQWLMEFLTLVLATILGHHGVKESALKLYDYTEQGMRFVLQPDSKEVDIWITKSYLEKEVSRAFPELKGEKYRIRAGLTQDPYHSNMLTLAVWVFDE